MSALLPRQRGQRLRNSYRSNNQNNNNSSVHPFLEQLREEDIYLVVAAYRNSVELSDDLADQLPPRTMVLNRDRLNVIYGPSLKTRPQFVNVHGK